MYHLDLYRLQGEEELEGIGWEDFLYGDGVAVIEWAEKIDQQLPKERLDVVMVMEGLRRRRLILIGHGYRFQSLVNTLAIERR